MKSFRRLQTETSLTSDYQIITQRVKLQFTQFVEGTLRHVETGNYRRCGSDFVSRGL